MDVKKLLKDIEDECKAKKERRFNLVAKHANKFNKAAVHRDRKNDYSRKTKHKKDEE